MASDKELALGSASGRIQQVRPELVEAAQKLSLVERVGEISLPLRSGVPQVHEQDFMTRMQA